MNNKSYKNFLVFLLVMLLIYSFASYYMQRGMTADRDVYTHNQFEQDLAKGGGSSVEILQSADRNAENRSERW